MSFRIVGSFPGGCEASFRWLATVTGTSALEETGERSLCPYPGFCASLRLISHEPTGMGWGEPISQGCIFGRRLLDVGKSGVVCWRFSPKLLSVIELSLGRLVIDTIVTAPSSSVSISLRMSGFPVRNSRVPGDF